MGGFTKIQLKDTSEDNINKHNKILDKFGLNKAIRFYSEEDVEYEYLGFRQGEGIFPAHQFPKDKINSFEDFKKYWSSEAIGETFCPPIGSLTFDCYFGRTSKRAMRTIGGYVGLYYNDISEVSGSFETFMERGMIKGERLLLRDSHLKGQIEWDRFKEDLKGKKALVSQAKSLIYEQRNLLNKAKAEGDKDKVKEINQKLEAVINILK